VKLNIFVLLFSECCVILYVQCLMTFYKFITPYIFSGIYLCKQILLLPVICEKLFVKCGTWKTDIIICMYTGSV
jgi:hypothetical protein